MDLRVRFRLRPNVLTKVNSLLPNTRFVIAFHSPDALPETGLRMYLPEKSQDNDAFDSERPFSAVRFALE